MVNLGQVRVLLRGELQQEGLRELGGFFGGAERETPFLQCEPVDVAVEGCERVCCQVEREPGVKEAPDDGVVVSQGRGSRGSA